jgi:hypothetical protein
VKHLKAFGGVAVQNRLFWSMIATVPLKVRAMRLAAPPI